MTSRVVAAITFGARPSAILLACAFAAGCASPAPMQTHGTTPTGAPSASDTAGPVNSAGPSPTPSPRATADLTVVDAPVIARIEIPFADTQTPFESAVAVVDGSVWLAVPGRRTHLVRIDAALGEVAAVVEIDPSALVAGDGTLWTMSPVDVAPGPPRLTLSYVDIEMNTVIPTRYPEAWAAGLGFLWGMPEDGLTLYQVEPETGQIATSWSGFDALGQYLQIACDRVWIEGVDDTVTAFDPATGERGTPIDISMTGLGRIHETSDGCWAILGSPGDFISTTPGFLGQVDSTGIVHQSPPLWERAHIAGDTFWTSTAQGEIQRIDPSTGERLGHPWQLPTEDLPTNAKLIDWRLMSIEGELYLLTAASLYHLGIQTVPQQVNSSVTPQTAETG